MFNVEFDRLGTSWCWFASGVISVATISESWTRPIALLVAAEGPVHFLLDFSAVETVSVTQGAIAERGKRVQLFPGHHRIIVAPQPEIFGLFCLFGANQSLVRSSVPLVG